MSVPGPQAEKAWGSQLKFCCLLCHQSREGLSGTNAAPGGSSVAADVVLRLRVRPSREAQWRESQPRVLQLPQNSSIA